MLDTRRSRLVAASCLALSAVVAAFVAWTAEERRVALLGRERVAEERLDRLVELTADLDARAAAITTTAVSDPAIAAFEDTLARSDAVVAALRGDAFADTIRALDAFEQASRALEQAVAGARRDADAAPPEIARPQAGGDSAAPDAGAAPPPTRDEPAAPDGGATLSPDTAEPVLPEPPLPRPVAGAPPLGPEVRRVRQTYRASFGQARAELADREWSAAAVAGAIWSLGLLALVWLPRARPRRGATASSLAIPTAAFPPTPAPARNVTRAPDAAAAARATVAQTAPPADPDLTATVRVCTDIARLASLDGLPDVLGRAAAALGARGLMLWSPDAQRLVPWISHGYPAAVQQRVAAIDLADTLVRNPVTDAWRTGEAVAVPASTSGPAALAVPVAGPGGCTGVLALELHDGITPGALTLAKASFVAAQLGAVLSPSARDDAGPASADARPSTGTDGSLPHAVAT